MRARSSAQQSIERPTVSRRNFLYAATAAVGAAGLVAAAWPLVDHLNPDAAIRASGDVVDLDLAGLAPAQPRVAHWHGLPIFVVRRTAVMIDALKNETLLARMADPRSEQRQQPAYAANWHRSLDPAVSVLIGVCTSCGCIPQFHAEPFFADDAPGAYLCACCASHFDPAGRPYAGPAQYNLPVPPHDIVKASRLVIGRNTSDVSFTLDSIERM
jgi:ubiquinol-cytochrome c reductase iron-sulfur subunit